MTKKLWITCAILEVLSITGTLITWHLKQVNGENFTILLILFICAVLTIGIPVTVIKNLLDDLSDWLHRKK